MGLLSTQQTRLHAFRTVILFAAVLTASQAMEASPNEKRPLRQYVHDHWMVPQGLPQNSVYALLQSRDGYLWFGTQEGLVRFDGVQFKVFDRTNSKEMRYNWVLPFAEDDSGGIWQFYASRNQAVGRTMNGVVYAVDTADGLPSNDVRYLRRTHDGSIWIFDRLFRATRYANGRMKTYGKADGLPTDSVFSVSLDSKGNVWFNTPQGIVRYDGRNCTVYSTRTGLPGNSTLRLNRFGVEAAFEDSKGNMWMSTNAGLARLMDGKVRVFTTRDGLLDNICTQIIEDSRGALWIVSLTGICKLADDKIVSYPSKVPFVTIRDYCVEKDNTIWLATERGLWRFSNGAFDHYGMENGLTVERINSVFVDREGSVWFGAEADGLHRLREGKFVTYSKESGLIDESLDAVFEDSHRDLWMGSGAGGLAKYSGGRMTIFNEKDKLPRHILGIGEDREGTIWVTAFDGLVSGLFTIRNGVVKQYTQKGISFQTAYPLMVTKSGAVVVGLLDSIVSFQNGKFTLLNRTQPGARTSCLMEDSRQRLWVGTFNAGVYMLDGSKITPYSVDQGFGSGRVFTVFEDHDGTVWIGSGGEGVYRFKNGKFFRYDPENGFPEYNAGQIIEDNVGYLWFGTNKAVYRIEKKALDDFAEGRISSYSYNTYGTADGMKSGETDATGWPNAWKLKDGRIAFTTVAGAAVVNPADIQLNTIPPPVVIDQFIVEGTLQPNEPLVKVAAGREHFEFHYAGLSFIGADKVRYKYKLEGQDEDWIDAGTRRDAYYTSLRPGKYTFRVIAANSDGVWNEKGASLEFEMMPFFYQSTWFLALCVISFLAGGPSFYFIRMKSVKKRAAELESLVQKRTGELQKTLDHLKETQNQLVLSEKMASLGQLTAGIAHEIKNPLNFITNFAVLSHDLAKDLRTELAAEKKLVDPKRAKEIEEILTDLEQNVAKINEHGKRADSIVRGMLLHSRGKPGEKQETDVNALLAEYTNLAYHGMRALDQSFNVKIETDLDPSIGKMKVVPQDLSRAFLNIVNNACYAANDKRKNAKNGFSPVVRVSARNLGDKVEIRIRDNGNGIPPEVVDKMFNPFFTTKPAGVGTGLGLSLTYDIITQVHKGEINVDTKEGEFAEFIIRIPRDTDSNGGLQA